HDVDDVSLVELPIAVERRADRTGSFGVGQGMTSVAAVIGEQLAPLVDLLGGKSSSWILGGRQGTGGRQSNDRKRQCAQAELCFRSGSFHESIHYVSHLSQIRRRALACPEDLPQSSFMGDLRPRQFPDIVNLVADRQG